MNYLTDLINAVEKIKRNFFKYYMFLMFNERNMLLGNKYIAL